MAHITSFAKKCVFFASVMLIWVGASQAQPVSWDHPDGTTHWYEAVSVPSGINWIEANESATSAGGYLVTLTSQEENGFVFSLIDDDIYWYERPNSILAGPWTGGLQPQGSPEPDGNWHWVTGEPFTYINWTPPNEPNNMNGNQNRIHFGEALHEKVSTWNDVDAGQPHIRGYIIEYDDEPVTERTVGLFLNEEASFEGYTLFAPIQYTTTYLINNEGLSMHSWESDYQPGNSVYLLENGHLLLTCNDRSPFLGGGGAGGKIQEFDWDGSLLWEYDYSSDTHRQHHDVEMLPSGNILMIAWERKTQVEAIQAGRNPNVLPDGELWPDHIIEVEPDYVDGAGTIVWEWHVWDHLVQEFDATKANYGVVADHPELIHINYISGGAGADWNHTNAIDYNKELDQIIVSVRGFCEIWVIDHSTTAEEAAGHTGGTFGKGGDLLYRWGNPQAYGAGDARDQKLFVQHDAQWIESELLGEGNILIFNNGAGRPEGNYTSVDEIEPPVDEYGHYTLVHGSAYGPEDVTWSYTSEPLADFYADHISGAQRLPNSNTLICDGPHGTFFEVTYAGEVVWKYINPVTGEGPLTQGDRIPEGGTGQTNSVFRVHRYAPDFPGLDDKNMTPGDPIELYPTEGEIKGDVNGNGQIDLLDVVFTVNHILGMVVLSGDALDRTDCNGDGTVDVLDALRIVNVILGIGECEP
jgi:hypothetical protein